MVDKKNSLLTTVIEQIKKRKLKNYKLTDLEDDFNYILRSIITLLEVLDPHTMEDHSNAYEIFEDFIQPVLYQLFDALDNPTTENEQ